MDRFLVVSSDGHAGPPANQYREYLEDKYKPMFDEHQQKMREQIEMLRGSGLMGDNQDFVRRWEKLTGGDGGLVAGYDSERRNEVLNNEGVAAEVLFPDADVLGTGRVVGVAVRFRSRWWSWLRARRRDGRCACAQPVARRLRGEVA